jgi:hypothetical protein
MLTPVLSCTTPPDVPTAGEASARPWLSGVSTTLLCARHREADIQPCQSGDFRPTSSKIVI